MKTRILLALMLSANMNPASASDAGTPADPAPPSTYEIPVLPHDPGGVNVMAQADGFELQWWSDKKTGLFNFRQCTSRDNRKFCEAPMLLNGLPAKDLPIFMAYYVERLDHWGSGHLTQLASVLMKSFGTATALIGSFAVIQTFKGALPAVVTEFIKLHPVRYGVNVVGVGTAGVLVFVAGKNLLHFNRQKVLRRKLMKIEKGDHWELPVNLDSSAYFEEMISTLRQALYEYTHGGPAFDQSDNLIFQ